MSMKAINNDVWSVCSNLLVRIALVIAVVVGSSNAADSKNSEPELASDRTAHAKLGLRNNTDSELKNVTFQHTNRGQKTETIYEDTLDVNSSSKVIDIKYTTGSGHDDWYIEFTMNGQKYKTPYWDRCDITAKDEGLTVWGTVQYESGHLKLAINTPKSSGSIFTIKKDN